MHPESDDPIAPVSRRTPDRPLVCPEIENDERLDGYLARVLVANGYPLRSNFLVRKAEPEAVGHLGDAVANAHRVQRRRSGSFGQFGRFDLPAWAISDLATRVYVCSDCLKERPRLRMAWGLQGYRLCTRHQLHLVGACRRCNAPATAVTVATGRCHCGGDIDDVLRGDRLSDGDHDPTVDLWRWIDEPGVAGGMTLADPGHECRQHLGCSVVAYHLIRRLSYSESTSLPLLHGRPLHARSGEYMRKYGLRVGPTIDGVSEFLKDVATVSAKSVALRLLRKMAMVDSARPTLIAELPLLRWMDELLEQGAGRTIVLNPDVGRSKIEGHYLGLQSVANALRTSLPMVKKLARSAGIELKKIEYRGRFRYQIFNQDVAKLRREMRSLRTDQRLPGLSSKPGQPDGLPYSRMPTCTSQAWFLSLLDEEEVKAIYRDIARHAHSLAETDAAWMSLADPEFWEKHDPRALMMLLNRLRAGQLPAARLEHKEGWSQFVVPVAVQLELRRLDHGFREARDATQVDMFGAPDTEA